MVTKHILAIESGSFASIFHALVRAPFAFTLSNPYITWLYAANNPQQMMWRS